ncbi:hypothetical protein WN48_08047 [Eufriesea mexicana]|uniref:Uncharacterized protein n=1 Tax=Eufriesea mexicana TaxID=516756 RepID=A0A310SGR8_9HYME|nr:hypothetical protein WN48_08047 [Eufriesea mexicana]
MNISSSFHSLEKLVEGSGVVSTRGTTPSLHNRQFARSYAKRRGILWKRDSNTIGDTVAEDTTAVRLKPEGGDHRREQAAAGCNRVIICVIAFDADHSRFFETEGQRSVSISDLTTAYVPIELRFNDLVTARLLRSYLHALSFTKGKAGEKRSDTTGRIDEPDPINFMSPGSTDCPTLAGEREKEKSKEERIETLRCTCSQLEVLRDRVILEIPGYGGNVKPCMHTSKGGWHASGGVVLHATVKYRKRIRPKWASGLSFQAVRSNRWHRPCGCCVSWDAFFFVPGTCHASLPPAIRDQCSADHIEADQVKPDHVSAFLLVSYAPQSASPSIPYGWKSLPAPRASIRLAHSLHLLSTTNSKAITRDWRFLRRPYGALIDDLRSSFEYEGTMSECTEEDAVEESNGLEAEDREGPPRLSRKFQDSYLQIEEAEVCHSM